MQALVPLFRMSFMYVPLSSSDIASSLGGSIWNKQIQMIKPSTLMPTTCSWWWGCLQTSRFPCTPSLYSSTHQKRWQWLWITILLGFLFTAASTDSTGAAKNKCFKSHSLLVQAWSQIIMLKFAIMGKFAVFKPCRLLICRQCDYVIMW